MTPLIAGREFAQSLVARAIPIALGSVERKTRRAFFGLLGKVHARSDLLRPERFEGRAEAETLSRHVGGMLALAEHRKDWLRPVEAWAPQGHDPGSLFSSLAHHLLASYPVPPVLTSAWFEGLGGRARRHQGWFKRAGSGKSLRTAGFPIRLSRRMAHEFANAPADFAIGFALRWAQVRGLGSSDALGRALAATSLGDQFWSDGFWTTVILFLIRQPKLDLTQVGPIVDYLYDQKFVGQRVIVGEDTEVFLDPPHPGLSLKGWTLASLVRRVDEWKARATEPPRRRLIRWPHSGIGAYRRQDEEGRAWTIRELLDSDELAAEGKAMAHCVAGYTDSCSKGESTIWSLGIESPGDRQRVLTIEVAPNTKEVVQAKMKGNDDPDERSRSLLEDWARQESLTIAW
jgi:hypothetical protein